MAERTEEHTREPDTQSSSDLGVDVGTGTTATVESATSESSSGESGSYFSLRALLFAFVAVGGGMAVGGAIPLIPFTQVLGVLLGGFLYGLVARERRYLEICVAGGLSGGVAAVLSLLPQLAAGLNGGRLFAIAAGVGLVLALVGHYFGRDLRSGLTKDLE